jgi:hypothetical protein
VQPNVILKWVMHLQDLKKSVAPTHKRSSIFIINASCAMPFQTGIDFGVKPWLVYQPSSS